MIWFLMAAFAAMVVLPCQSASTLAALIERLDDGRRWSYPVLTAALCVVWGIALRDAERLNYAGILAGLWREWFGY